MPPRSFYLPPDFGHVEEILRDAHGLEAEDLIAQFRASRFPPLADAGSVAQILGISAQLIFSITRKKEKHYRRFTIKKSGGGVRDIASPRTYLKVIQWWVLDNILRGVEFPENVMGFVRGRSVLENAKFHFGASHILNMDLKDFFPSVGIDDVSLIFGSLGYNQVVANQLAEICTLDDCLPQGAPTSPTLANMAASGLDKFLIDLTIKHGMKYTRYADDLVFSSNEIIPSEFQAEVVSSIAESGFSVNERKTRFRGRGGRMEVTGLVINSYVQPPRHWRNKVRQIFFQAKNHPEDFQGRVDELYGYLGAIKLYAEDDKISKLLTMGREAIDKVTGIRGQD